MLRDRSEITQKSKPQNGPREIFATVLGETARARVSVAKRMARDHKKTAPIRDETDSPS